MNATLPATSANPEPATVLAQLARITRGCAVAVLLLVGSVLMGWLLNFNPLQSLWPGLASMSSNTMVCFALAAGVLLFKPSPRGYFGAALVIAAIASAALIEDFFGLHLLPHDFGFNPDAGHHTDSLMSQTAALLFLLFAAALVLRPARQRRLQRSLELICLLIFAVASLVVLGYGFGRESVLALPGFENFAVRTALSFLLLALGLLCTRGDGMAAYVAGPSLGGGLLRLFLPLVLVVPAVLGWSLLQMGLAHWFDGTQEIIIFSVLLTTFFSTLCWRLAQRIDQQADLKLQSETKREQSDELYRSLFNGSLDAIFSLGIDGRFTVANPAALALTGLSLAQLQSTHFLTLCPPDQRPAADAAFRAAFCSKALTLQTQFINAQKERVDLYIAGAPALIDGELVGVSCIARNTTAQKKAERELLTLNQTLEQRVLERSAQLVDLQSNYQALYTSMEEAFFTLELVFDQQQQAVDYRFLSCNPAFEKQTSIQNPTGRLISELIETPDPLRLKLFGDVANTGVPVRFERHSSFNDRWFDIYAFRIDKEDAKHVGVIMHDLTEHRNAQQAIEKLAFYDALTGLPNRRMLLDRLQQALARSERSGQSGALIFMDLDNFKTLNDTQGHDAGDRLLIRVAQVLQQSLRETDSVARFGGDEFVMLLENINESEASVQDQLQSVGDHVLAAFALDAELNSNGYHCRCSMGVTLFSGQQVGSEELLKQADMALYQAKADGRDALRFFDNAIQSKLIGRAELEADLRHALSTASNMGQFSLHYQPVVNQAGQLTDVEALLRWNHPTKGVLLPGTFISVAEETGLIHPLGQWVLNAACRQLARWAEQPSTAGWNLAVNVSTKQFHRSDFIDQINTALAISGASASQLKLEITESLLIDDANDSIRKMKLLQAQGIGFLLDDFGTGYSSLSYLSRLPLDYLKIDRSFVINLPDHEADNHIVQAILAMAHRLGIKVVAEGVETAAQWQFLKDHGCQAFQGHLFGHAVQAQDLPTHGAALAA
ncbi:MAG: EAL domain-containing protein [Burkholderiaceae bacterium]